MRPDLARACLQLLQRVDIKGHEVQAFLQVVNALEQEAVQDQPVDNQAEA